MQPIETTGILSPWEPGIFSLSVYGILVLAFTGTVIYSYYEAVPRLWGIDPVTDQRIGGVIMWIPGSMMFIIAALILIARMMQEEESKPALTEKAWASDEAISAPGLKR